MYKQRDPVKKHGHFYLWFLYIQNSSHPGEHNAKITKGT